MRTYWHSNRLNEVYDGESLLRALLRDGDDREQVSPLDANLVSSLGRDGKHYPVIDLDIPHRVTRSSTEGHGHLYLDVPMSWFRYVVLLAALRFAGVIEKGFFWWSIRRGATFARLPGVGKEVAY